MAHEELLTLVQRRIKELEVYNKVGKTLTSTLDLKVVLNSLMEHITNLLQPGNWSMLLIDEQKKELFFEIVVGEGAEVIKDIRMKIGEGICGWVAAHGKSLLIADVNADPRFSKKVDNATKFKTEAIVAVPMISMGKCLGVIELINKKETGGEFTEDDLKLLQSVADYAAIAIQNANNYKRIHELTITDDVTRLYNSRYMHQLLDTEITKARQQHSHFSLVFIDLDYFKTVNDTHGHLHGSQLLRELGEILWQELGNEFIGTRYGGDEFVLLLPGADKKRTRQFAEHLRNKILETTFLEREGLSVHITASFGLATFPDDASTKDELVRLADQAMYRVKETTRNAIAAA